MSLQEYIEVSVLCVISRFAMNPYPFRYHRSVGGYNQHDGGNGYVYPGPGPHNSPGNSLQGQ